MDNRATLLKRFKPLLIIVLIGLLAWINAQRSPPSSSTAPVAVSSTAALSPNIPTPADQAQTTQVSPRGLSVVQLADLPAEARQTLTLIAAGGPFPYERDGVVFGNFEKRLPPQKRGYYHEYTVATPAAHNRGARRIITGDQAERYYTADHYRHFSLIQP